MLPIDGLMKFLPVSWDKHFGQISKAQTVVSSLSLPLLDNQVQSEDKPGPRVIYTTFLGLFDGGDGSYNLLLSMILKNISQMLQS